MKTRYLFGLPFVTIKMSSKEEELLVDTGFNGSLLLPLHKIHELSLSRIGFTRYALADGTVIEAEVFVAEITWLSKKKRVNVISSPSDFALLGMELLRNTKTVLEPAKGVISIEPSE